MTAYQVAFLRPGTLWDRARPVREQVFWDEHARFMDAMFEDGTVVLGGPFTDGTGSMVVLKARDAAHVREMFLDDPWTVQDVLVVAEVKEWTLFLDARDRRPPGAAGG